MYIFGIIYKNKKTIIHKQMLFQELANYVKKEKKKKPNYFSSKREEVPLLKGIYKSIE